MAFSALVSAAFAGILALFTWRLILVGRAQHKAASDQHQAAIDALALAREEFVATHRPRIRIRVVRSVDLKIDAAWNIYISFVNVGVSPATVKKIKLITGYRNKNTREWESKNPAPQILFEDIALASGKKHEKFVYTVFNRKDVINYIETAPVELCCFGEITYADGNETVRSTGFMWIWEQLSENFVRVDEPEFSYED